MSTSNDPLVLHRGLDKGKCRSCKADIVWAVTLTGKKSPFVPDPDGIYIIVNGEAKHVGAPPKQLELGAAPPAPRFTSHFANCPQQQEWRNPR